MKLRLSKPLPAAAAQAGISVASAYRLQRDPRLPSDKKTPRERRRPDPLADIFEMNVESYRRRTAIQRKQTGAGRPASYATPKNDGVPKPGTTPPPN